MEQEEISLMLSSQSEAQKERNGGENGFTFSVSGLSKRKNTILTVFIPLHPSTYKLCKRK